MRNQQNENFQSDNMKQYAPVQPGLHYNEKQKHLFPCLSVFQINSLPYGKNALQEIILQS